MKQTEAKGKGISIRLALGFSLLLVSTSSCIKPPVMPRNPGPISQPATIPAGKTVPSKGATVKQAQAQTASETTSPAEKTVLPETTKPALKPEPIDNVEQKGNLDVETEIRRVTRAFGYKGNEAIPPSFVKRVEYYIHYFSNDPNGRDFFCSAMNRGQKYAGIISADLAAKHLPMELGYLPLVESGYNPRATSHAGAVGMWQFMKGTARRYGLKVTRHRDDRRDPARSTRAAGEYLDDLLAMFGVEDPFLGISAYNAGEGRVLGALRKTSFRERSFWVIAKKGMLADETQNYIPKWLAATILAQNPGYYGLSCGGPVSALVMKNPASAAAPSEVVKVAQKGPSPSEPQQRTAPAAMEKIEKKKQQATTSPVSDHSTIKSETKAQTVVSNMGITSQTPVSKKVVKKQVTAGKKHLKKPQTKPFIEVEVVRGDTLFKLATALGKTVRQLKTWNHMRTSTIHPGQKLKVYGMPAGTSLMKVKVHRGDSLPGLAKQYKVSVQMLQGLNNVTQSTLRAGTTLRLYTAVPGPQKTARHITKTVAPRPVATPGSRGYKVSYTVQYKGNLALIALAYDLDIRDIMKWNHLRHSRIYPKQKLTLYLKKAPKKVIIHIVKKGETAGKIAKKYKVSMYDNILALNGLVYDSTLSPGKNLKVYIF